MLVFVAAILAIAAFGNGRFPDEWTAVALALSMGAVNTVLQRSGEVSIGVTYMTGTLVSSVNEGRRFGRRSALGVATVTGALGYSRGWRRRRHESPTHGVATISIWIAAAAMMLLSCYAAILGPVDRSGTVSKRRLTNRRRCDV